MKKNLIIVVAMVAVLFAGCTWFLLPSARNHAERSDTASVRRGNAYVQVSVPLEDRGSGRGIFGDTNVQSVTIVAYNASGTNVTTNSGVLTKGTNAWVGSVGVSATGLLTFKASAKNISSIEIYRGWTQVVITGAGDSVVIGVTTVEGQVGEWLFCGNMNDTSGKGHHGTTGYGPTLTSDRFGKADSAYLFNGSSDEIRVPNSSDFVFGTGDFAISAWIYPTAYSGNNGFNAIITKHNGDSNSWLFRIDKNSGSGNIAKLDMGTPTEHYATTEISLNAWHHVMIVRSSNISTFYLDGAADGSFADATDYTSTADLWISRQGNTSNERFTGKIDDVRVYNRALAAAEIQGLYHETSQAIAPALDGLLGEYLFNGGAVNDSSGMGNDYTAYNGPTATTDRFGRASSALSFDGSDDYLSRAEFTGNSAHYANGFTVSAWVRADEKREWCRIIDFGNGQDSANMVFGDYGSPGGSSSDLNGGVFHGSTPVRIAAAGAWTTGTWRHFVLTIDASASGKIYADNILAASGSVQTIEDAARTLNYVARSHWGADPYFKGAMDDIRVYNRVLSPAEIGFLYHEGGWDTSLFGPGAAVASWVFDGNANDSSGNGHHGTAVNGAAPAMDRFGNAYGAYAFDGSDDYIGVPTASDLVFGSGDFTVGAWIRASSFDTADGGHSDIVSKHNADNGSWILSVDNNASTGNVPKLAYMTSQSDAFYYSDAVVSVGVWHFVAVTRSGSTCTFYYDGSAAGTFSGSKTLDSMAELRIGSQANTSTNVFNGTIDDVRIFDRALSATEIGELYHEGGWSPSGLSANYDFVGYYNGHEYWVSKDGSKTWWQSRDACVTDGGHLIAIGSAVENDIAKRGSQIRSNSDVWIGYSDEDIEGCWTWVTGETTTYTNWNGGEPNNAGGGQDIAKLYSSGYWDDEFGSGTHYYILEIEPTRVIADYFDFITTSGGHDYYISKNPRTWYDANKLCGVLGGHLVSIQDATEDALVAAALTAKEAAVGDVDGCWIGFNDNASEGSWVWSAGESGIWQSGMSLPYTHWDGGEPNNSGNEDGAIVCGHAGGKPFGSWNDRGLSSQFYYVMEIGTSIHAEPSQDPTSLTCGTRTNNSIALSWTDAAGAVAPDGYLLKWSSASYAAISDPVDGIQEWDGDGVKNLGFGVQAYTPTGLSASTQYYFKMWSFTNNGTSVNYKTGTPLQGSFWTLATILLSSGSSWSVPAGISSIKVWVVGAGGGGAGTSNDDYSAGGGGGAGGTAYGTYTVAANDTLSYSIGSSGAGSNGASNGNAGGDTSCTIGGTTLHGYGGGGGLFNDSSNASGGSYMNGDGGSAGGTGAGPSNFAGNYDNGGGGGGGIGGAAGLPYTGSVQDSGGPGGQSVDMNGLSTALSVIGISLTSPGNGADPGTSGSANNNHGGSASGFGCGGGGAGYYGGNGGNGQYGGGGGGASGYSGTHTGGNGGMGVVVIAF